MVKTTTVTTTSAACLALCMCLAASAAIAQDSPHWNKSTCGTCHTSPSPTAGNAGLKHAAPEEGCEECHAGRGDALPCRHASDLEVGNIVVPDYYRQSMRDGKILCTTCHDLEFQCQNPRIASSFQNPGFLRNRVSRNSADQCFECHDAEDYVALNPHRGTFGTPPRPTCLLCHASMPEALATGELSVEFNMKHDLNDACRGCHNVRSHPQSMSFGTAGAVDEWTHLVRPPAKIAANMQKAQAATGIELPLDPQTGKVYCATCHNPHEFKVGGAHGSAEPAIEHRLRIHDICQACHDK